MHFFEDSAAKELESKGLIVIRTYAAGCPDLIAFPKEIARQVIAHEIKSPSDKLSLAQDMEIKRLCGLGVSAKEVRMYLIDPETLETVSMSDYRAANPLKRIKKKKSEKTPHGRLWLW